MSSIAIKSKEKNRVPKGAEIIRKSVNVSIEEIENGFLIVKSYDVEYRAKNSDKTDYVYYSQKMYTKENPLKEEVKESPKFLADIFNE